ncbi:MAG: hypothetical protein NC182_01270 [Prevotella sp.]|nr:hypothetical protein [Staphylococcus sp.]MCM1349812.1 hypothetical protein [Prevotella sp.]
MLFKRTSYIIQTIEHTAIDDIFIKRALFYQQTYPFRWNYFVYDIISKPQMVYTKDSTMILNLNELPFKELQFLFGMLKDFLNYGIIQKIIYKREFMILHFHQAFHMEFFKTPSFLMSVGLYQYLRENYLTYTIYYGAIFIANNEKYLLDLVLQKDNQFLLFDGASCIDNQFIDDTKVIYLYHHFPTKEIQNYPIYQLKWYYDIKEYELALKKMNL